jgi:23S rRNA (pseudouridine1915-N3)-methyltransferase
MKIKILSIGATFQPFVKDGVKEFLSRIEKFTSVEYIELKDVKNAKNLSNDQLKKLEGEVFLSQIESIDTLVLLDENGKNYTSRQFANIITQYQNQSTRKLVFIIGGAYGFSEELYSRANSKLSLSSMTFSHQLIRLIFVEQLYRAYSIIHHLPYHHD